MKVKDLPWKILIYLTAVDDIMFDRFEIISLI